MVNTVFIIIYVFIIYPGLLLTFLSCQIYVISRRGVVQQGSAFGSIFLLFPISVATGITLIRARENPWPPALRDSPDYLMFPL